MLYCNLFSMNKIGAFIFYKLQSHWLHLLKIWMMLIFLAFPSGCAFMIRTPAYRVSQPEEGGAPTWRGVYHVHSAFSPDSKATLDFVIKTANKAGLDFVMITDHNNRNGAQAYREGSYPEKPLLIFGTEHSRYVKRGTDKKTEGHLVTFGVESDPAKDITTQELIDWAHAQGGYAVLAHPLCVRNPWRNWEIQGYDGMEVYNFPHSLYEANNFSLGLKMLLSPKRFLNSFQKTPEKYLDFWKFGRVHPEILPKLHTQGPADPPLKKRVAAFGAVDAHLHWKFWGMSPDSYLLYFQSVTMYVLADDLTERKVIDALGKGKSFLALEAKGEARGFSFYAISGETQFRSGETLSLGSPVQFSVTAPGKSQIRLLRDGEVIAREQGKHLSAKANGPGVYHAELYKNGKLWILANPIYVDHTGAA